MKSIFDEASLGTLNVKNRIVRSATWEGMAGKRGEIPVELYEVYKSLAKGGVGTIITGFTSVSQEDFYFDGMMRLGDDSLIPEYQKLTELVHQHKAAMIAQLALGGYYEKTSIGQYQQVDVNQLTADQIKRVVSMFGEAAVRAQKAGFDGVQIHAAHFFFLSRFISPAVNHRQDEYGGSTAGRSKLLVDIVCEIKKLAPDLHISMKINVDDGIPRGLTPSESLKIAKTLEMEGLDSLEISANGTSVSGIKAGKNEGYFFEAGKAFAEALSIPVILVGGHRSAECMNEILEKSHIEFLSISRPLIREPNLVQRWMQGDLRPSVCVSCNSCYHTSGHQCIFLKDNGVENI